MTPEQAIHLLDQVAAQVQTTREAHGQIQIAIQVLRKFVADANAKAEDGEE